MADDLPARRARHQELPCHPGICHACSGDVPFRQEWPCDAAVAFAALAAEQASHRGEHVQMLEDTLEQERAARQAAECQRDNWQESARQFCVNADYWRERAEAAEAERDRLAPALGRIADSGEHFDWCPSSGLCTCNHLLEARAAPTGEAADG